MSHNYAIGFVCNYATMHCHSHFSKVIESIEPRDIYYFCLWWIKEQENHNQRKRDVGIFLSAELTSGGIYQCDVPKILIWDSFC